MKDEAKCASGCIAWSSGSWELGGNIKKSVFQKSRHTRPRLETAKAKEDSDKCSVTLSRRKPSYS